MPKYPKIERKSAEEAEAEVRELNEEFARIQRKRNKPKDFNELAARTYAHWNKRKPESKPSDDTASDGDDYDKA